MRKNSKAASVGGGRRPLCHSNTTSAHFPGDWSTFPSAVTARVVSRVPPEPRGGGDQDSITRPTLQRGPITPARPGISHCPARIPARRRFFFGRKERGKVLPKLWGLRVFSPGREARPPDSRSRRPETLGFQAGSARARAAGPAPGARGWGSGRPSAPGPGRGRRAPRQSGGAGPAGARRRWRRRAPRSPHLSSQKVQGECSGTPPGSGRSSESCCRPSGGAVAVAAAAAARGPGGARAPAGGAAAGGNAIFSAPPARPADARTAGRGAAESPRPPPAPPRPPRPAPRAPRPGPALRPPGLGAAPPGRPGPARLGQPNKKHGPREWGTDSAQAPTQRAGTDGLAGQGEGRAAAGTDSRVQGWGEQKKGQAVGSAARQEVSKMYGWLQKDGGMDGWMVQWMESQTHMVGGEEGWIDIPAV